jgi:hypothetical protein
LTFEQTVHAINWAIIFYICFALFVLFILHSVFGLSFTHTLSQIVREFRTLLGRGPISRAKLNALLIVALICLTAFYAFVEPIRHLIELTGRMQGAEPQTTSVVVAAFFMICVTGFLSVLALPK